MANKEQIKNRIAGNFYRDDLDTEIYAALDRAIDHYNGHRFWFTEGRTSFTVSAGATAYTLSVSMVEVLQVTITRNGVTYGINPIPEAERLTYDSSNVTGDPSWYSLFGNVFIPYPQPNQTYTVELTGTRKQASVTNSGTNAFTLHAEELLEGRAGWYVALHKTKDLEAAAAYKAFETQALTELRRKEALRGTNRVTPTQF